MDGWKSSNIPFCRWLQAELAGALFMESLMPAYQFAGMIGVMRERLMLPKGGWTWINEMCSCNTWNFILSNSSCSCWWRYAQVYVICDLIGGKGIFLDSKISLLPTWFLLYNSSCFHTHPCVLISCISEHDLSWGNYIVDAMPMQTWKIPTQWYCRWKKSCSRWDVSNPDNNGIPSTGDWCRISSINRMVVYWRLLSDS